MKILPYIFYAIGSICFLIGTIIAIYQITQNHKVVKGDISNVIIYNRKLTEEEIKNLYE